MIRRGEAKQQEYATAAGRLYSGELAGDQPQTGSSSEVVARIKATAAGFGARAKQQGSHFYQASLKTAASTAEGIKRLALGEPLQALCRTELTTHPCPQLMLACCTALVSGGGVGEQRIFKHNPPQELVDKLAATAGSLTLLSPGASPHAVAALLKQFLLGLPEPLLTYRLLPQWVAAGDQPDSCRSLLHQLPAANAWTLRLLMQTCHYINEQAATNEMDSQALAEVLAPCLAWKPPPKPQGGTAPPWQGIAKGIANLTSSPVSAGSDGAAATAAGTESGSATEAGLVSTAVGVTENVSGVSVTSQQELHKVTPLDEAELEAVVTVLEHMISNYNNVFVL
eukprot:GHRR01023614.1.p1 GENE.GHRR01023614.1~~GHRR01023614.1.p1  ORF type:complete len:340 (+),score=135.49 GHRR01023614.1:555-1574(+)